MQGMVRVRIAPSPTGIPHIGNTRTALFNYLFAKKYNGKFILRIEDTDQKRIVPGAQEAIYEILEWLGLKPDEIYIQSERLDLYKKYTQELVDKNLAYIDEGAIRFRMPKDGETSWRDGIGKKSILFENKNQEDFIILKSDGFPTYHLASVVDDHDMQISDVIRGDEWISSTPKHIQLYKAFGWKTPGFAHLPVILGPDKTKLSKRHGAASVLDYREMGYLREALINYMVLLGWSPSGASLKDIELFTLKELEDIFLLEDVNTASPIFDVKKLLWMNGVYIRQAQNAKLKAQILAQNSKLKNVDENLLDKLIPLAQTRMETLHDFYTLTSYFFEAPDEILTDSEKTIAKDLLAQFVSIKVWNEERILSAMKVVLTKNSIKMSVLYKIMTGQTAGLPLPQSLAILGKDETIKRLQI